MSRWRNRIVGEAMADPAEILGHPANFRRHADGQRTALYGSLATCGSRTRRCATVKCRPKAA